MSRDTRNTVGLQLMRRALAVVALFVLTGGCSGGSSAPDDTVVDVRIEREFLRRCDVLGAELYDGGALVVTLTLGADSTPIVLSGADLLVTGASTHVVEFGPPTQMTVEISSGAAQAARACVALHLLDPTGDGVYELGG